jgi:hypothetical protein
MKKALLLGLVAALVLGLGMVPGAAMAKDYSIKIGGGPTGGTFNTFANGMAVYVPKVNKNIQATAVGSGGSVENVKRVSRNESNFGMCYAVDSGPRFPGQAAQGRPQVHRLARHGLSLRRSGPACRARRQQDQKRHGSQGQARGRG